MGLTAQTQGGNPQVLRGIIYEEIFDLLFVNGATLNDVDIGQAKVLRLTAGGNGTGTVTLNGVVSAKVDSRPLTILAGNTGTTIDVAANAAGSLAVNQFTSATVITGNAGETFQWNGIGGEWIPTSGPGAASGITAVNGTAGEIAVTTVAGVATVALAAVANDTMLGNVSGGAAASVALSVAQIQTLLGILGAIADQSLVGNISGGPADAVPLDPAAFPALGAALNTDIALVSRGGDWGTETLAAIVALASGGGSPAGTPLTTTPQLTATDAVWNNYSIYAMIDGRKGMVNTSASWIFGLQIHAASTNMDITGAVVRRTLTGSGVWVVEAPFAVTWGGNPAPSLAAGENFSDPITMPVDYLHDTYVIIYLTNDANNTTLVLNVGTAVNDQASIQANDAVGDKRAAANVAGLGATVSNTITAFSAFVTS